MSMTVAQVNEVLNNYGPPSPNDVLLGWVCDNNMFVDLEKYSVRYDDLTQLMYLKPINNDKHSKDYYKPGTSTLIAKELRYFKGGIMPYDSIQYASVYLDDVTWVTF